MNMIWLTKRENEKIALSKGREKFTGHEKRRVKRYNAMGKHFKQH
jgi:hypothetical protein